MGPAGHMAPADKPLFTTFRILGHAVKDHGDSTSWDEGDGGPTRSSVPWGYPHASCACTYLGGGGLRGPSGGE